MVMMMTNATTKKPTAPLDVPVLPTADDYRDGMNKMRAKINCPALSADEQALADELCEFDWRAPAHDDYPHELCPSVDEYLKQQYLENTVRRFGVFEASTDAELETLRQRLNKQSTINLLLAFALLCAFVAQAVVSCGS